jgi:hypothetical protein
MPSIRFITARVDAIPEANSAPNNTAPADVALALAAPQKVVAPISGADAASPMMQLIIGGSIIGGALLMFAITRFIVSRRVKRLDAIRQEQFKPLLWQAQDLVSREDMKAFWMRTWNWSGIGASLVFGLIALTGVFMSFHWTLRLAAKIIVAFGHAVSYVWQGFIVYLPNLETIIFIIVARYVIRLIGLIFEDISSRRIYLKNFYLECADTRGRVVERSTFATRIQSLKNVIVSIPNSMVLTNNIINYSKNSGQSDLLVHTGVTIGYDVP